MTITSKVGCLLLALAAGANAGIAQEDTLPDKPLTARYVMTEGAGGGSVELYVGDHVARLDMSMGMPMSLIVQFRSERALSITLMSDQKQYIMESQAYDSDDFEPLALFVLAPNGGDIEEACSLDKNLECELLGNQTVAGRASEHWRITSFDPEEDETGVMEQWIDTDLGLLLKFAGPEGWGFELKELDFGLPSPDLFEIPDGYTRFGQDL